MRKEEFRCFGRNSPLNELDENTNLFVFDMIKEKGMILFVKGHRSTDVLIYSVAMTSVQSLWKEILLIDLLNIRMILTWVWCGLNFSFFLTNSKSIWTINVRRSDSIHCPSWLQWTKIFGPIESTISLDLNKKACSSMQLNSKWKVKTDLF